MIARVLKIKNNFYRKDLATLPRALKENGYVTEGFGSLILFMDGLGFGVDYGFDEVRTLERIGYDAPQITYEAVKWLNENADKIKMN